jgi:cell division protein FtsI (penicillin-binding protein 3)
VTPEDRSGRSRDRPGRGPARRSAPPAGPDRRPGDGGGRRPDGGGRRGDQRSRPAGARPAVPAVRPSRGAARRAVPRPRPSRPRPPRPVPARPGLRRAGPSRRLGTSLVCIGIALTVIAGRLVQLQGLHWSEYRALAQHQMLPPQPISIPVLRGSITSSDGTVLAMTVQTDLVYADPVEMPQAQRPQIAAAVAGPLGMTPSAVLAPLDNPTSPQYVVLKRNVPAATGTRIMALGEPGIAETPTYSRIYPNGDLAANLVGFTGNDAAGDLTGAGGLEQEYNSLLAGRDGSEEVELGPTQQPLPQTEQIVKPSVPASSLRLTINSDIQWDAEQECATEVRAAHARNCSVVVMNPRTGHILALAQYPTFNPSDPSSVAATTDIPVQNVFQPGSTAKVITAAAALERGGQTPMSTYTVPDQITVDGFSFHDGEYHATGKFTIAGIIANSFNDGMVQVAQHISPQIQYDYFKKFGIGAPTGLNLPGESAGLLPPVSQWWGDERYTLSFGQGVAVNAVQMASVYATIANGGVRVQPSVVAGTVSDAGTYTPAPAPRKTRVLQPKTASELMQILQQVPFIDNKGGEPWGIIPGYSIASKTGTAQVPAPGKSCLCEYGSSYIGIAPASDPQLVVAVNVQDPTKGGYFGDEVAGPVFYQVAKFALQTLRIPPDDAKRPRLMLQVP